jgi:hypothetical protein
LEYTVIPGANAMLCALVMSGFDTSSFAFFGFLNEKNKECNRQLNEISSFKGVSVIYSSKYNINSDLNKLANALPTGKTYFYFWMYNPTSTVYNFHLAGDCGGAWTDSKDSTPLAAKAWTKIVISAEDIALNTQGQWYVYIQGGDGAGATKEGWKISTTYAVKSV